MKRHRLIYALVDPVTNEIRYIGQSCKGMRRPRYHVLLAKKMLETGKHPPQHVYGWLVKLLRSEIEPETIILEEGHETDAELDEAEMHFISYFRYVGARLTNMTSGGEHTTRGLKFPKQAKRRAEIQKKKYQNPLMREELVSRFSRKGHTASANEKRRNGVRESWEVRRKMYPPNGHKKVKIDD